MGKIFRRGRLTLKEVDSIQHYYGLAIRKNLSSVEDMKRAIWAIYFHKLSTEDNPQHALCPLVFVGIETLKFGVMDAVICFNDGYVSRIKVFEALGIKPGYNTERALLIIDNKRIFEAERIVNKVSLEARNKRRSLKRKMDKQNLDEENEYQAGNSNQIYNGLHRNVGASRFNGPYGRQGYVLALQSGGRLDGNESVADSFRSDLVGFKKLVRDNSRAFTPSSSARKTLHCREAHLLPEVNPIRRSLLFQS
ncbi:uncharacterized protein TNCV_2193051 [Trichonephila clavipes]|nr:uncharacterized protein TNCV_2193051 [Trichonephila clavipes]